MTPAPPPLYFRLRDHTAAVFRLETETRHRRLEMTQIATVNTRNGEIKPRDEGISDVERAEIAAWAEARAAVAAARAAEDAERLVDALNLTAHWLQTRASDAEVTALSDRLLLAMHDLRAVIVRRLADRDP